jgi:hypothetical protein
MPKTMLKEALLEAATALPARYAKKKENQKTVFFLCFRHLPGGALEHGVQQMIF